MRRRDVVVVKVPGVISVDQADAIKARVRVQIGNPKQRVLVMPSGMDAQVLAGWYRKWTWATSAIDPRLSVTFDVDMGKRWTHVTVCRSDGASLDIRCRPRDVRYQPPQKEA